MGKTVEYTEEFKLNAIKTKKIHIIEVKVNKRKVKI